jgi:hypothetical protein
MKQPSSLAPRSWSGSTGERGCPARHVGSAGRFLLHRVKCRLVGAKGAVAVMAVPGVVRSHVIA